MLAVARVSGWLGPRRHRSTSVRKTERARTAHVRAVTTNNNETTKLAHTFAEAAQRLDLSPRQLQRLVRDRRIVGRHPQAPGQAIARVASESCRPGEQRRRLGHPGGQHWQSPPAVACHSICTMLAICAVH